MTPYKLGQLVATDWLPNQYPNVWQRERTTGPDRLVIAPASHQIDLMIELSRLLPEPFGILYVLLVPRGDSPVGRYQKPEPASREEMEAFFREFQEYFERDGRHHVWVMSLPADATLVYDNHNVIYAYGPLEEFKEVLARRGLVGGPVTFPSPHSHNYNVEFDHSEERILSLWDWKHSPLMDQDEP